MISFKEFLQLDESMRALGKAIKAHYKSERKQGNALMHPAVATAMTGSAVHNAFHAVKFAAQGDLKAAAVMGLVTLGSGLAAAPHIKDTKRYYDKYKEQEQKERQKPKV